MSDLKKWAVSVIVIMACTASMKFVIPSGKVKKAAGISMTLTVLLVMLSPLLSLSGQSVSFDKYNYFESTQFNEENGYIELIRQTVENCLEENGIEYKEVNVIGNMNSDRVLEIQSVIITLEDNYDTESVLDLLEAELQLERGTVVFD